MHRSVLRSRIRLLFSVGALLVVTGCATSSTVKQVDRLAAVDAENPRILVMTPDVKYFLLTASGLPEPHAEWTIAARSNFSDALKAYAGEHDVDIQEISADNPLGDVEIRYQKLYSAVGTTILTHHFGALSLPTKNKSFDWSLGPGVREIADKYDADYALFSYYRDYQASGGRIAFAIIAAAAGASVSTGGEGGFASLVDLNTGNIVWFNQVLAGVGELRDPDGARKTVDQLFKDLPGG